MWFHFSEKIKGGKYIQYHIIPCNQDGLIFLILFLITIVKYVLGILHMWVSWFFVWETNKVTPALLLILVTLAAIARRTFWFQERYIL